MCDCSPEEIEAIAVHEHLPDAVASEYAEYLIRCPDGVVKIKRIILDDIECARNKGCHDEVEKLNQVLMHFIARHPEYRASPAM
jgi:hypothetical protein